MKLIIPHEFPSLNEVVDETKTHWSNYAKMKSGLTLLVKGLARRELKPVNQRVHLRFAWYCRNRRRDPDNIASAKKFILDGLVTAGVLPDDSWKWIASFNDVFYVDQTNPRVEVFVEPA